MKRLLCVIAAALVLCALLCGCAPKNDGPDGTQPPEALNTATPQPESTSAPGRIFAYMAYEGVSNYCRAVYGWGTDNEGAESCSLMMGEETGSEYLVIFHSYTDSLVDFYVDKTTGLTRVVERVPALGIEEEVGIFDLFDYLGDEGSAALPTQIVPEPTAEPTPEPETRFVFQPKVCSVYMEEVFGETMCETWFNLVDAVMAGEDTFACPDKYTYDWVMGQFPNKCFPVLTELIDYAWDRDHSVVDGVATFTWLVPKEEAAERIAEFAQQVEDILNEKLKADYTDVEKALALYIHFSRTYEYDWDTYYKDIESPVDYTSTYRFFKTGIGICREIAPAYSYLLMQVGVDATIMMDRAHEWSYIRINGHDYHVDPTYALSEPDKLAYFMMTDEQREASGFSRDEFVITSNYSQDHPHPDYIADDDFFAPVWDCRAESFSHEEKKLHCWKFAMSGDREYFDFDYSGFDAR